MARPLRIEYPGAFYHVTARGNERKDIFLDDSDREKFLSYLETAFLRYKAAIHVYCLMSNHYHLLIETPEGNLSQIMRHINGAYTTYVNSKRQRTGHLFQGRYKAILVEADEYAGELSRYMHLNPVRAGIVTKPEDYDWSSYRYYLGKDKAPKWLTKKFILKYFGGKTSRAQTAYQDFINAMSNKEYESPLQKTVASTILGNREFVEEIKGKYLEGKVPDRNLPALRQLKMTSVKDIEKEVEALFGKGTMRAKKASLYLCHTYSGRSLKEIGTHFHMGESAVSQASRRFRLMLEKDNRLKRNIHALCGKLNLCNV